MKRKERVLRDYFKKAFEDKEEMIAFLLNDEGDATDFDVYSSIASVFYAKLDEAIAYRIERNLYGEVPALWISETLKQLRLDSDLEWSWQERGRYLIPVFRRIYKDDRVLETAEG